MRTATIFCLSMFLAIKSFAAAALPGVHFGTNYLTDRSEWLTGSNGLNAKIAASTNGLTGAWQADINTVSNILATSTATLSTTLTARMDAGTNALSGVLRALIDASTNAAAAYTRQQSSNNVRISAGPNITVTPTAGAGVMDYQVSSTAGGGDTTGLNEWVRGPWTNLTQPATINLAIPRQIITITQDVAWTFSNIYPTNKSAVQFQIATARTITFPAQSSTFQWLGGIAPTNFFNGSNNLLTFGMIGPVLYGDYAGIASSSVTQGYVDAATNALAGVANANLLSASNALTILVNANLLSSSNVLRAASISFTQALAIVVEANLQSASNVLQTAIGTKASKDVYRTVYIDAGAMVTNVVNAATPLTYSYLPPTNRVSDFYAFDDGTTNGAQFKFALPLEWDLGTIKCKVFWSSTNASANMTNVWEISATAMSDDDTLNTTWGTAQTITDKVTAADDLLLSPATAALTIGNTPAAGDLCWFQVRRLGGHVDDSMLGRARLLGVWIQYRQSTTEPASW